jgi:hypothetical protein
MTLQAGSSTCRCCGKALTDSLSVELGIGPVCRITAKTKEAKDMNGNLFSNRADYDYTVEDGVVCIVDNDNGKSVTNDADAVIEDLVAAGIDLAAHLVIYRDTMGVWDQLLVSGGKFASFKSINEREKAAAKAKVLASREAEL